MNLCPTLKLSCCASALIAAAGLVAPTSADIVQTYNFYRISNNASSNIGGQLSVDVHAPALNSTFVNFTFRNTAAIASNVVEIYFDDGSLFSITNVSITSVGSLTVPNFFQTNSPSPSNLPGGNLMATPFVMSQGFAVDSRSGNGRGLNEATDSLTIRFSMLPGKTFQDTLAALLLPTPHTFPAPGSPNTPDNWLRIGMHVRSIGGGNSDSYVNSVEQNRVTLVPLPPAAFAGLGSLACVAFLAIRRRRSNAAA